MTSIDSRERPHSTKEMLAGHRVFRRESALMPRLVHSLADRDNCGIAGEPCSLVVPA
jgi:hypothetical protein